MACSKTANNQTCGLRTEHSLDLKARALKIRQDIITMVSEGKSGHPGGSLSSADIMSVLFFSGVMKYNQQDPNDHSLDRFFLSKGHAAPVLYAVYHQLGWIGDEDLHTLRQLGTKLQGHPDCHACPGVEVCSGSLGQGLSVACGVALGLSLDAKQAGTQAQNVFVLLGDGEMQEGSNWEAMMFAAHKKLGNLIGILDLNNLQIDGNVQDVCSLGDIDAKCEAFGWHVIHTSGHCVGRLEKALTEAVAYTDGPVMVIGDTVKGKGVSFMENQASWHGKAPNEQQTIEAITQLKEAQEMLTKEACND